MTTEGAQRRIKATALAAGLLLVPVLAQAHSFGQIYVLPVPVWLYLYGAAAALALSFVVTAYMLSAAAPATKMQAREIGDTQWVRAARTLLPVLQGLSVACLLLCIATGLWGTENPYGNFNMTFFWVIFVLGFAYATALIGNLYAVINPWRVITAAMGRYRQGCITYPQGLSYWPAFAFYLGFVWIELFGHSTPYSLALILLVYTGINLVGTGLIGARAWFGYCELFSVFFRLIGDMAPLGYRFYGSPSPRQRMNLRAPFTALLKTRVSSVSLLLFILFMLSSTAFDGLHETQIWRRLFWVDLYQAGLQGWVGTNPFAAFPKMNHLYRYWQTFWLLASPFVYLAAYLLFIWFSKLAGRSRLSVRTLALRFATTLLPIALVYNITHYYTLVQSQGIKILSLASDPFNWGWNLFGTSHWFAYTIVPDVVTVWHVQVALIVAGHIVSVYLAHRVALDTFATRRLATLSQLPMLVLMVLFTTMGLWILAQPVSGG